MAKNVPSVSKTADEPVVLVTPTSIELSAEQKMELVLSHRKALACRVNLTNLAEELKQHEANFQATVNRLVAELKVDGNEFVLDLDKLAFVPK